MTKKKRTIIAASAVAFLLILAGIGFAIYCSLNPKAAEPAPQTEPTTTPTTTTIHEHSYLQEEIVATCEQGGYVLFTCACGENYRENETDPLAHEFGDWKTVVSATTEAEGEKEQTCLHCSAKNTAVIPKIEKAPTTTDTPTKPTPPTTQPTTPTTPSTPTTPTTPTVQPSDHTHSYTTTVVEASCASGGYTRHTCSCGKFYDTDQTSAWSHLYGNWEIVTQATTTSTGERKCVCTRCGHVLSETIPVLTKPRPTNVDSGIEIKVLPDGATRYLYGSVVLVDTRTWGDAPTVRITSEGGIYVSYFKKDGSKVEQTVNPKPDHSGRMVIWDDGSFESGYMSNPQ